jgi:hypothetical protein
VCANFTRPSKSKRVADGHSHNEHKIHFEPRQGKPRLINYLINSLIVKYFIRAVGYDEPTYADIF